jgi:MFS family permease
MSLRDGSADRQAGAPQALALILAMTLPVTPLLALVPNLPQLFQHFASTPNRDFLVPMIITMPSVCIALLAPVAGTLADRFGRRRLMILALALFTVCGLLPLWMDDLYKILAAQVGVGVAEAIIMTTGNALLGDYFAGAARQKWLGVQGILGSILATLIMLSGGALGTVNWHAPFLMNLLGGIVFVWMVLATWELPQAAAGANADASGPGFPWRAMGVVFAVTLLTSILYFTQTVNLGLIFSKLGAGSSARISVITTIASLGVIAGGWLYRQQRRVSVGSNIALIYLAYAVGLVGLGLSGSYLKGLPFGIVAQFGNGLVVPVFVGWALRTLDPRYRGRGMGLWTTFFFCGQFLSPNLVALVSHARGGDLLGTIVVIGITCALLAIAAWLLAKRNREAPAVAG